MVAKPFVMGGEEDGGVAAADEALERRVLVLRALAKALLQPGQALVQRVVLSQEGVRAVLPRARVDVGVVVAVGADDQRTRATWQNKAMMLPFASCAGSHFQAFHTARLHPAECDEYK